MEQMKVLAAGMVEHAAGMVVHALNPSCRGRGTVSLACVVTACLKNGEDVTGKTCISVVSLPNLQPLPPTTRQNQCGDCAMSY